jgi:hypothetical protein
MPLARSIIITDPVHQVMSFGTDERLRKLLKSVIDIDGDLARDAPLFSRGERHARSQLVADLLDDACSGGERAFREVPVWYDRYRRLLPFVNAV